MTEEVEKPSVEVLIERIARELKTIREGVGKALFAIGKNYPPLIMGQCWKILDPGIVRSE